MTYCYFVYVSSYEESEFVQKKLFKLGYKWVEQSTWVEQSIKVLKIKNTFIYSYSDNESILYYNTNVNSLNNKKRDGYKCIKFNLGPLTKSILRLG